VRSTGHCNALVRVTVVVNDREDARAGCSVGS